MAGDFASVCAERTIVSARGELGDACVLELFGPSSGGKSTLVTRLLAGAGASAPVFALAQDRLLERAGLAALPAGRLRKLLLDLLVLGVVLLTWRRARGYYAFSAREALTGDFAASAWLRLNLLRNAWKGVALRLVAPRLARPGEVLVLDEGPLQTANYLLVHAESAPKLAKLETLLRLVPLPDAVVYVRVDEEELVRRTERRGHPRVPASRPNAVRRFVRHALAVFDRVAAEPRVAERMVSCGALAGAARRAAS